MTPDAHRGAVTRRGVLLTTAALAVAGLAAPDPARAEPTPTPVANPVAHPSANPAPGVVPALQTWTGGEGMVALRPGSRIIVTDPRLDPVAQQLRTDLDDIAGFAPRVLTAVSPRARDIVLRLDPAAEVGPDDLEVAAREGYRLAVDDRVTITARTVTGAFWATRTVLQMMVQQFPDQGVLPVGSTVDWPNVAVRGYMLDVGRRWFGETYLHDMVRVLSWFKLNTFQVHLNDNQIHAPGGDWSQAYAAFRLRSDNPDFAGLAADDGSLTRAQWDALEDLAATHHVQVVPEIDSPAHSRAFIAFRPELGLDGGNSDHLDLSRPETTAFMTQVFDEFTPWFRSEVVHIGLDEYPRELAEQYREYVNALAAHVRSLGKTVRAWGSLTVMSGGADGYDRDLDMVSWNNSWYSATKSIADGYPTINANDGLLYIVPFANYYHGHGLDGRYLYDSWEPHVFGGSNNVDKGDPLLLGAMSAVWNDLVDQEYDGADVWGLVEPTFGLLAHKMWRGPVAQLDHGQFMARVGRLGVGPGTVDLVSTLPDAGDRDLPVTLDAPQVVGEGETVTVTATITNTGSTDVTLHDTTLAIDGGPTLRSPDADMVLRPGRSVTRSWRFTAEQSPTTFVVTATGRRARTATVATARGSVAVVAAPPPGTRHLSFDAVASASSVEAGLDRLAADKVNDGDPGTRWASNYTDAEWVQLRLAQPSLVESVRLLWEDACAASYRIQTSVDGSTWTDAAVVDDSTCATDDIALTTTGPVSYVRMQGVTRATGYGYSLYEFWVFGNPA